MSQKNSPQSQKAVIAQIVELVMCLRSAEGRVQLTKILDLVERDCLVLALKENKDVRTYAARALCLNRTTLIEKLRKHGRFRTGGSANQDPRAKAGLRRVKEDRTAVPRARKKLAHVAGAPDGASGFDAGSAPEAGQKIASFREC